MTLSNNELDLLRRVVTATNNNSFSYVREEQATALVAQGLVELNVTIIDPVSLGVACCYLSPALCCHTRTGI
jgi:hypothetical protein